MSGDDIIPFWQQPLAEPQLVVDNTKPLYSAFEVQDKLICFIAHCHGMRAGYSFTYASFHGVMWTEDYDYLAVTTTQQLIRIYGHHLQPIANALNSQTCKAMREFDKTKYTVPTPNDTQPYIERILVTSVKDPANVEARKSEEV